MNDRPSFKRMTTDTPGGPLAAEAVRDASGPIWIGLEDAHGVVVGPWPAEELVDLVLSLWESADEEVM